MKTVLALFLFTASLQVAPTPGEMYNVYDKDGKYRELTEQVDQMAQRMEEIGMRNLLQQKEESKQELKALFEKLGYYSL